MLYAYAEGPRALTRPSGPYNWPRLMFIGSRKGFGPEEAVLSYSWLAQPQVFGARKGVCALRRWTSGPEGRFGTQVGDADGLVTLEDGKGGAAHLR